MMLGQPGQGLAQQSAPQQPLPDGPKPQTIPDAPKPQALPAGTVTPGRGTTLDTSTPGGSSTSDDAAVPNKLPETATQKVDDGKEPDIPPAGDGPEYVIHTGVNFVEIPFTVKDNKGKEVPRAVVA